MAIKIYKPTSPGRRIHSVTDYSVLTKNSKPVKSLMRSAARTAGRNNQGKITIRHQGGGHKQINRLIDFKRDKMDIPAIVKTLEYDPGRSAFISLLAYRDGERRYILAPDGVKMGEVLVTSERAEIKPGNRMMLKHIPLGTNVHNVEILGGQGGLLARSAGTYAIVAAQEPDYTTLKLPSSELRKVPVKSYATIGQVSNTDWMYVRIGKAGRVRHMGVRPSVRGKAMNPIDHPHGGGEGHNPIGLKYPKTPWGKHALGVKTRDKKKSNKFIVKRREK
ncbi:MAG: 50S ribosomal protein L2 [Candidatus Doudnabacteria bacterium]